MAKLTQKQELDLYMAKLKIDNKGIESFKTALFETDCKITEKTKKIFFVNYKSKEVQITPEYAKQIINIDNLRQIKHMLEESKEKIIQKISKEDFDLVFNNVYYSLSVYKLKLDEREREEDSTKLVDICNNKLEISSDYYSKKVVMNPLFEQEKNYLKALLKYNKQKILNYQKQQLSTKELENKSEEMDK